MFFYRDNNVYRLLSRALESPSSESVSSTTSSAARTGFHSNCVYRDDLRSRVGSKSALGEYMSGLYETSAFMVASRDTVQNLVRTGKAIAETEGNVLGGLILSIISMLSKYCPQSFEDSNEDLTNWLKLTIEGSRRSRVGASKSDALPDKGAMLSLLSAIKLSAPYLWPVDVAGSSPTNGRKSISKSLLKSTKTSEKNDMCDALFNWCANCSDAAACYALSEVCCIVYLYCKVTTRY